MIKFQKKKLKSITKNIKINLDNLKKNLRKLKNLLKIKIFKKMSKKNLKNCGKFYH